VIDDSNQVKETTMATFGLPGNDKTRCVCQKCEDVHYIPDDLAYDCHPIVDLNDMMIDYDWDAVCVSCLTEEESVLVDQYYTEMKKGGLLK
jgi:hypothetical protein